MKKKDCIVILSLLVIIIILIVIGCLIFKANSANFTNDYSVNENQEMKQLGEIKYIKSSEDNYEIYSLENELIDVVKTFDDVEFYSEHPDFYVEFSDIQFDDVHPNNEELETEEN